MTPEQQVRLEIVSLLLRSNVDINVVIEYAEKMLTWVLSGKKLEATVSYTEPAKFATENPLRIKVNAVTGIPVEFSR